MTDKFYIDDNNSVALPVYINNFISNNKDDLKSIYETNSNNKEGFLYRSDLIDSLPSILL